MEDLGRLVQEQYAHSATLHGQSFSCDVQAVDPAEAGVGAPGVLDLPFPLSTIVAEAMHGPQERHRQRRESHL